MAWTAAWVRSETSSLRIMRSTWILAVHLLMFREWAICWLVRCSLTSASTSASRSDTPASVRDGDAPTSAHRIELDGAVERGGRELVT